MSRSREPGERVSPKELVLLGLLAEGPSHAWALEQKIRSRRMHEWTDMALSSVYRVLHRLTEIGSVESELAAGGPGAVRRVYSITSSGRESLADNVLRNIRDLSTATDPFHVSLAFITEVSETVALAALDRRAATIEQVAADLRRDGEELARQIEQSAHPRATEYLLRLHLLFAHFRHHLDAERSFLAEARPALRRGPV